ncbi:hypothetical protein FOZ63_014185, partial [Perkinsus olseni]
LAPDFRFGTQKQETVQLKCSLPAPVVTSSKVLRKLKLGALKASYLNIHTGKSTDMKVTPGPGQYTHCELMGHADLPRLFQDWQRRHPEDYGALSLRKSTACSGLGVFATTDVAEGDILYEDRHPLVSMHIGKLSEAFDHVLDLKNMSLEEDFPTLGADIIWFDSLMQCPACIPSEPGHARLCANAEIRHGLQDLALKYN